MFADNGWPAPAKLNLLLKITGRRSDGYHLLQTVFQFLDYGDTIDFELTRDGRVTRANAIQGLAEQDDLVVRAARLLQQVAGCSKGARILVEKRLPMGAGLGGGSSDAATTLVALNRLWSLHLSTAELMEMSAGLGADVPVFVSGKASWAEGIGEQLSEVTLAENYYLVVTPPVHVSTAEIFNDENLTRNAAPITIRDFLAGCRDNDCLPVVERRYPVVIEALEWLGLDAPAYMTGTGASVFAAFETRQQAEDKLAKLPKNYRGFVAMGKNSSPLYEHLAK